MYFNLAYNFLSMHYTLQYAKDAGLGLSIFINILYIILKHGNLQLLLRYTRISRCMTCSICRFLRHCACSNMCGNDENKCKLI